MTLDETPSIAELMSDLKKLSGNENVTVDPVTGHRVIVIGDNLPRSIALAVAEARELITIYGNAYVAYEGEAFRVMPEMPRTLIVDEAMSKTDREELKTCLNDAGLCIMGESYQIPPFKGHAGLSKIKRKAQWKDETYGRSFRKLGSTRR